MEGKEGREGWKGVVGRMEGWKDGIPNLPSFHPPHQFLPSFHNSFPGAMLLLSYLVSYLFEG